MKAKKPFRVALIVNTRRRNSRRVVRELLRWLTKRKVLPLADKELSSWLGKPELSRDEPTLRKEAQVVLAVGGDGTILRAARVFRGTRAVILGVNLGSLGFLSDVRLEELYPTLDRVLAGKYDTEKRMMLEATATDFRRSSVSFTALNDIVVSKTSSSRALRMKLLVSGSPLGRFTADGLIVSTPTGSTAYSLSAGGPIMKPTMTALLATPICPHSLSARPVVISGAETLTVQLGPRDARAKLIVDGHDSFDLHSRAVVRFKKARDSVSMVTVKGRSFYDVLREKFKWGGVPARDARGT